MNADAILGHLHRSMGPLNTETLRYAYGPDAPTVEALAAQVRALLAERDMLAATKLARAMEQLGREEAAWRELAAYLEEGAAAGAGTRAAANTALRRAAHLREVVREIATTSVEEPAVLPSFEDIR